MKLLRVPLLLICLAMSGQTPDPVDLAWNDLAIAGNAWRTQHNSLLLSKADHERLKKFEAETKRFFRLAKEAQF